VQHKANGIKTGLKKISLANFSFRITLSAWAESVRLKKLKKEKGESQNGLENPKNRGSAGRHGNQHVCVCGPQVSQRDSFTFDLRWTSRRDTFPIMGS
jgi:hypothetical protein